MANKTKILEAAASVLFRSEIDYHDNSSLVRQRRINTPKNNDHRLVLSCAFSDQGCTRMVVLNEDDLLSFEMRGVKNPRSAICPSHSLSLTWEIG